MGHSTSIISNEHAVAEVDVLVDGHASLYGMPVSRSEPLDSFVGAGGVVSTAEDVAAGRPRAFDEGRDAHGWWMSVLSHSQEADDQAQLLGGARITPHPWQAARCDRDEGRPIASSPFTPRAPGPKGRHSHE